MTRPRTPASAMTTLLPRPRSGTGSLAARANRTSARSSKTLCAIANRSAGPPTRIVVNRASGSSRTVLTPIRRWMSVPVAIGSNAAARLRHRAGAVTRPPRARRRRSPRRRERLVARDREDQLRDRVGGAGPASSRAAADIRRVARRVGEQARRPRAGASRVELLVLDQDAPRPRRRTARRWRAGGRPRAGTGRSPSGARSAAASARVDAPARPTTRSAAASAAVMSSRRNGYGR